MSQERKKMIRSLKKELGLHPFGTLEAFSTNRLKPEVGARLNSRERESLDIQAAVMEVSWPKCYLIDWVVQYIPGLT